MNKYNQDTTRTKRQIKNEQQTQQQTSTTITATTTAKTGDNQKAYSDAVKGSFPDKKEDEEKKNENERIQNEKEKDEHDWQQTAVNIGTYLDKQKDFVCYDHARLLKGYFSMNRTISQTPIPDEPCALYRL